MYLVCAVFFRFRDGASVVVRDGDLREGVGVCNVIVLDGA